jgi:hypothetical protein
LDLRSAQLATSERKYFLCHFKQFFVRSRVAFSAVLVLAARLIQIDVFLSLTTKFELFESSSPALTNASAPQSNKSQSPTR